MSPASSRNPGSERLTRGSKAIAENASADVLLQFDQVSNLQLIERAAACGVDAVMAGGSKLPYEENLEFIRSEMLLMRELE